MTDFGDFLHGHVHPGALHALVGAGGKSTGMRVIAALCNGHGMRVRMTTTTRVGVDEFAGYPVRLVSSSRELARAMTDTEKVLLIADSVIPGQGKYRGLEPHLLDEALIPEDTVVLVEADGSRKKPLKAPTAREPVIPASAREVFALMGAGGFDELISEECCYNHEAVHAILGRTGGRFDPETIAALASHPDGSRKGVLPGMVFLVIMNQGDCEEKLVTARNALKILKAVHETEGCILSWQKEKLYGTTSD